MRSRAAKAISTFSHPVIVFPTSLPFFLSQADLAKEKFFFLLLILFILAIPIFYFFYALKKKKISDWEMTQRRERYPLYLLSLFCGGLALGFLKISGSQILFNVALIFYLLGIFITLINFFWKISVHTAGITAGALVFNLLLSQSPYLYLLIPLVAWSRHEEKKHTPGQILAGVALGALVVFGVLGLKISS